MEGLSRERAAHGADAFNKEQYAANKQAEREELYRLADMAAKGVAGNETYFHQYLDIQSVFHRYSAINALLIMTQKPEATKIGDFKYWKKQNLFIKKGENAFSILEPQEYAKKDGTPGISYNTRKVFDYSQLDTRGQTLAPAPAYSQRQLLGSLVESSPLKIVSAEHLPDGLEAITDPQAGKISVLKGMAFPDTFRALAHELAGLEVDNTTIDPYFTAYSASYIVCKKYGIDLSGYDFTSAPQVFEGLSEQDIKQGLSQIRNTAENLLTKMERELSKTAEKETSPKKTNIKQQGQHWQQRQQGR